MPLAQNPVNRDKMKNFTLSLLKIQPLKFKEKHIESQDNPQEAFKNTFFLIFASIYK